MKQYISDIITSDEIAKWQLGDRILIHSQTGSGKSEFIKNNLYEYCKKQHKRILLLSNRNLLKNQNLIDIRGKTDHINAHNYQEFEARILGGLNVPQLFKPYDYIVYDEAHYIFSDSQFNRNTDLLIKPIYKTPLDKIFIFITATPDALLDFQPDYQFKYNLPHDYSYINTVYFYTHGATVESIIRHIPQEEKVIYFGSNASDTLGLSQRFENSSFICSNDNELRDKSNQETIRQIVNDQKFECRLLFATKLLDNGTNIKDSAVKHIIIDMLDPISFIQCIGRRRCLFEGDTINLYIRNYHGGNLYYVIENYNSRLKFVQDLQEMNEVDFKNKYRKTNIDDVIDNDMQINYAKYQHYVTQKRLLGDMFLDIDKSGYKKYVCELLQFSYNKIRSADEEFEIISMKKLLERNLNIKMFEEEQERFKDLFFDNIFTSKKVDYIARGIKAISGIIRENKLKYEIYSRRETKRENRKRYYWIIERLEL